ncbi:hypothetical protein MMC25_001010 [Agyrium rufum]|nr:hypothetical protein [Agyrium rufum]
MGIFRQRAKAPTSTVDDVENQPESPQNLQSESNGEKAEKQYRINHNGHKVHPLVQPDGESGRKGFHPIRFTKTVIRSSSTISKAVNILWPFVPAAIAIHFARPDLYRWVFALNYIAMVPTANLIGFAGQELARKLPKVTGLILETFLGSIVEIVLFMVLIHNNDPANDALIPVIKAAIIGSILANLLLCLGACFFVGGMRYAKQTFDSHVSEVGCGLLLVAGFGLSIPCAFSQAITSNGATGPGGEPLDQLPLILRISRATAVILLAAFLLYVFFQVRTHDSFLQAILEQEEENDADRERDLKKNKLTLTECILALAFALACVSLHAVFLVEQIEPIVKNDGIADAFMGLILVPLVEKLAEHLTAVDEAWDGQASIALAHVLGATIQTALLNSSLVVIVAWGLGKNMDLNFGIFNVVLLILAILVVGNFLRDGESNYLEGALCIMVYLIIAVSTFYYPNESVTEMDTEPAAPEKRALALKLLAESLLGN